MLNQEPLILRVLIICEAPNQWQNPLFRYLALEEDIFLEVALATPTVPIDVELGHVPVWGQAGLPTGFHSTAVPTEHVALIKWARRTARRHDLDVVVIPGWGNELARLSILMTLLSPRTRKRTVIFTDATDLTDRDGVRSLLRSVLLKFLSCSGMTFGVTGKAARSHLTKLGIKSRNLVTLPYAVDNDTINAEVSALREQRDALRREIAQVDDPDAIVMLAITKLIRREGPDRVVRSFLAVTADHPSARLVLVGDGSSRADIEALCKLPGGSQVILAGYPLLPRFYAMADWFIHLPDLEPWGLSVNEAAASGLPLLCSTRVGATQDLLQDGINGILVGDSDIEAEVGLNRAMGISMPHLLQMGAASVRLSRQVHYSQWTRSLRTLQSVHHQSSTK
jgi:glycosyltransferase involved in cell wall biosynthesis